MIVLLFVLGEGYVSGDGDGCVRLSVCLFGWFDKGEAARTYIYKQNTYLNRPSQIPDSASNIFVGQFDLPPVEERVAIAGKFWGLFC
jgi:hypothetical protein